MDCPNCKLFNPSTAEKCEDCGYHFRLGTIIGQAPKRKSDGLFDGESLVALGWLLVAAGILLAVFAGLRGSVFIGWGAYLIVRGSRKQGITDDRKLRQDSRSPVLYLRPFSTDESVSGQRVRTSVSAFAFVPRTPLERLARQLKKVGPFICVGNRDEPLPTPGPDTLFVPGSDWEAEVKGKIKDARFIVFRIGFNWNTVQEMEWAASRGPTRILFWFPRENEIDYIDFRRLAPEYLPCRNIPEASRVRFVYFDDQWNAKAVTVGLTDLFLGVGWSVWESLGPFWEQVGIDLEERAGFTLKLIGFRFALALAGALLIAIFIWSARSSAPPPGI